VEAERVAAEILADAQAQAARMREQTDDYVDASLERFEQWLTSSLETVTRGRSRVAASRAEVSVQARYEAAVAEEVYDVTDDEPHPQAEGNGHAPATDVTDVAWESEDRTAASA
jgi:hypothetical protein